MNIIQSTDWTQVYNSAKGFTEIAIAVIFLFGVGMVLSYIIAKLWR
jgi:hypothetical protein